VLDKVGVTQVSWRHPMSQTKIKSSRELPPELSPDWMRELEFDAQQMTTLVSRIDTLAAMSLQNLRAKDYVSAHVRLDEIRQGLRLLCELCEIKLVN
jgi:hypothetical protein